MRIHPSRVRTSHVSPPGADPCTHSCARSSSAGRDHRDCSATCGPKIVLPPVETLRRSGPVDTLRVMQTTVDAPACETHRPVRTLDASPPVRTSVLAPAGRPLQSVRTYLEASLRADLSSSSDRLKPLAGQDQSTLSASCGPWLTLLPATLSTGQDFMSRSASVRINVPAPARRPLREVGTKELAPLDADHTTSSRLAIPSGRPGDGMGFRAWRSSRYGPEPAEPFNKDIHYD